MSCVTLVLFRVQGVGSPRQKQNLSSQTRRPASKDVKTEAVKAAGQRQTRLEAVVDYDLV